MEIFQARQLIAKAEINSEKQHWLDLGCGSGTFTLALAQLLPPHSLITAIDLEEQSLPTEYGENVQIEFKQGDLQDIKLNESVEGVLMANSLHYVRDQIFFLEKLRQITPLLILVEYDTIFANTWVPFPVSFPSLETIIPDYSDLRKIGKMQSRYQGGGLYAAEILFRKRISTNS